MRTNATMVDDQDLSPATTRGGSRPISAIGRCVQAVGNLYRGVAAQFRVRSTAAEPSRLDDATLKDIGISRDEILGLTDRSASGRTDDPRPIRHRIDKSRPVGEWAFHAVAEGLGMMDQETIGKIFERNVQTLTRKPSRGFITATTKARLVGGLKCEIEEGPWRLAADLPVKVGGGEAAPTPGVLGRGALASCLAIGIARWAARLKLPIEALEVEVEADFDARGELGMGEEIRAGYGEVRYAVSIRSPAPDWKLEQMLDLAERYSPYLDIFGRAIPLRRTHSLTDGGE